MTDPSTRPRPGRRPRTRNDSPPEEPMTTSTLDAPEVLVTDPYAEEPDVQVPAQRASRLPSVPALRPLSPTPTYLGIGVAALGFVLIAVAWGQVAGETNVALQMPYLISGGLFGLALVLVGLTVVNVAAKRRDAALRQQQTELLADALRELRTALGADE